ncbi:restriction system protein [Arachidicoccus rhizosphaerae]|uniref:Restriction system protein n=1 Tax=Arachidicoccus rhizosphaerae TaxID=551991 RepID=A0A1H4B077_9BACT|nr:restriction endonuclease [Arachidicoccus rhizosphaerae]SEA41585.1 restriction system protein [Arachidicoccus rhizosphaerae]
MIPNYQKLMLPFLKTIANGREFSFRSIIESLGRQFNLTDKELLERYPNGGHPVFDNRVGWCRLHLKRAGLISAPRRGYVQITDQGETVLLDNLAEIDVNYLKTIPAYLELYNRDRNPKDEGPVDLSQVVGKSDLDTPEERLSQAYLEINNELNEEILNKVFEQSALFFERLVVDLLVNMGYGGSFRDAGQAIGKTGDEGIDGTIKEDKLGLDTIYIQAKRWKPGTTVGRPEIQKFVGALAGQGAKKGIFITTSSFTKDALSYVPRNETKIVLIDGVQLTQLMIDYNVGCTVQQKYEIKKIDLDYFEAE